MLYASLLVALYTIFVTVYGATTGGTATTGRLAGPVQVDPAFIDFSYQPVLPKVPGIDFLGWGYDATYRDQFYALKPSLFMYSYNNNPKGSETSFMYPTDNVKYAVPDQVYIRSVGKTRAQTDISDSSAMQRMRIDLRLNIKASLGQFEGALKFGFNMVDGTDSHTRICTCWAETELYQLYLGKRYLTADVISDMDTLQKAGAYKSASPPYSLFLSTWGTHFIDSVSVGGSVSQTTIFYNVTQTNELQLAVALSGKFTSGTGAQAKTIEGEIGFNFSQTSAQIQTQTTATAVIMGGDAKFSDYLLKSDQPSAAATLYDSWKSTLMKNPVAVRFRLIESWQLWALSRNNPTFALEVCKATADFLKFLKEDPSYCNGVPSVLSSYVREGGLSKGDTN